MIVSGHLVRTPPSAFAVEPAAEREAIARRLTYFMLLRVAVTSLLLIAAVAADIADPYSLSAPWGFFVFALIALTYGLTVLWALLLPRVRSLPRLAAVQIGCDLSIITLLIHAEGGAESGFVLLYLLVIVAAAMVLHRRGTALMTAGVGIAYVAVSVVDRLGLVPPWPAASAASGPLGPVVFALAKNLVLFAATSALARRLADELERAGERIAAQGVRLEDLATLHADVVRSLTSGLLTLSDDGAVRTINPAGEEILGVEAGRLIGRPVDNALPDLAAFLRAQAGQATVRRAELEIAFPDGERHTIGVAVSNLVNAAGSVIGRVVNFQDLTELRRMRQQVERSERLAAIGRLAAGIAHEIRNPLASISGSIQLLSAIAPTDGDNADLMEIVTREVDRLNRLITDLLDFARPHKPEPAPLEVGETLSEIVRVVENDRRIAPAPGRFRLDIPHPLWVDADPAQLRQVVLNLLINAADAAPDGAPIDLRASGEGDWVRIDVRDRGPGIPLEVRPHLFEPFFSTKKGGTGLGLATVHRIVEEHHGAIEIGDAPDGGAIVTVRLPRHHSPDLPSDPCHN